MDRHPSSLGESLSALIWGLVSSRQQGESHNTRVLEGGARGGTRLSAVTECRRKAVQPKAEGFFRLRVATADPP